MTSLDLTNIQGNILRGYGSTEALFVFLAVPDPPSGRAFLADLLPDLHNAADRPPPTTINLAVTFAGLRALGVSETILHDLPEAFSEPIRQRAARLLHDSGWSAPEGWDAGIGTDRCHLLVAVYGKNPPPGAYTARVREVLERAGAHGLDVVHLQESKMLDGSREHFGWADGLAQPAIEGAPGPMRPGDGTPADDHAWEALKAGEFILGYPDEDGPPVVGPAAGLLHNGTYMVYRKLRQDVVRFRRELYEQAQLYGTTRTEDPPLDPDQLYELMAAKVAGRWRNGQPIALFPQLAPEQSRHLGDQVVREPSNNFRYADDPQGQHCPIGAHIRRSNPRDGLQGAGPTGLMTRRHRIIRRGMPYGPWKEFRPGEEDDGVDRGLIFICFNTDLERQFELIQRDWCNDGNAFRLGNEQDYLLRRVPSGGDAGQVATARYTIGDAPPFLSPSECDVVATRGCQYLLMPGLDALRRLVEGQLDEPNDNPPAEEQAAIAEVVRLTKEKLERDFPPGTPMLRDQHAKSHGCVAAEFIVHADLPHRLAQGLFAQPGTYRAWVRFSSSFSPPRPDSKRDAHGMAIKVMGVDGAKILDAERQAATQDFVLANSQVFFCRNPTEYVELASKMSGGKFLRFFFPGLNPTGWRLRELINMLRATQRNVDNPLHIQYWSQTPSALGPQAVKYSAKPRRSGPTTKIDPQADDHLERVMEAELATEEAAFDFMVQLQTDERSMPVEDPTKKWSERASKFMTVATIRIPQQQFTSDDRKQLAENLSFTPWHSLPAHRPLGGINRVRRATYEAISEFRHERNGTPRLEPDP